MPIKKNCILLIDGVYVKPILSYHGGQLFGNSVSDNTQLAKSVLAFIVCLCGGPKFLVKMLPISKLDTDFLYDQSKMLIDQIKDSGGNLVAIICNNNRVNQAFSKDFHGFHFGKQRTMYFCFLFSFTFSKVYGIIGLLKKQAN